MAYPSTFVDIQNAVIAKLRLDATNDLSKVKDWINQAYADACLDTEVNQSGTTTITLTPNVASYTLSSSILRIKEMYVTPVGATQSAPLQLTSLDYILRRRQASGGATALGGYVTHYALNGLNDLELWPTPGTADTITVFAVTAPTALSANGDTPILPEPYASKVLEYGALAEGGDFMGDPQGQEYQAKYQQWVMKLRAHLNRKRGTQPGQFQIWQGQVWPPHDPSTDTGS